jgi:hypothetical protein
MGGLKPLVFLAGTKKDLLALPAAVDLIRERLKLALSLKKEP